MNIFTNTTSGKSQLHNFYHEKEQCRLQLPFTGCCSCWSMPELFCFHIKTCRVRIQDWKTRGLGWSHVPFAHCILDPLNTCRMKSTARYPALQGCGKRQRSQYIGNNFYKSSNIYRHLKMRTISSAGSAQNQFKGNATQSRPQCTSQREGFLRCTWPFRRSRCCHYKGVFFLCGFVPLLSPSSQGGLRHSGEHERLKEKVLWGVPTMVQ